MQTLLKDNDPAVLLAALETAVSSDWATLDELAIPIGNALGCPDRFVRMAAVRAMARMSRSSYAKAAAAGLTRGAAAGIGLAVAYSHRHPGYEAYSVDIARRILESSAPSDLKLDAARLMQIGLGDVGAIGEGRPEAFEGYTSRVDLSKHAAEFESAYKSIDAIFPTGDAKLDAELGRLIAMLQPGSSDLLTKVVARISVESNPVDDVHWLLVAGRVNAPRTPEITAAIARALVAIEAKIKERSLLIDAHWDEQLAEITTALVERDGALPLAILNDPEFGRPSHIQYVAAMPIEKLQEVIAAFVRRIDADPEFAWNGDVLFLLSRSEEPRVQAMVRSKFDDQTLRGAVILSISDAPKEEDRQLFVAGLSNGADEIVSTSLDCLSQLTPSADATEQVALTKLLRRLGDTRRERKLRNRITERLTANLGVSFQDDDGDGPSAVQKWISHVEQKFPASVANENGSAVDVAHFSLLLARAEWETGDFGRGRKLFETRQCIQCHSGRGAVGPDLNGVARRFSRDDLFTAIVNPSRDVSPRYETTVVSTADGRSLTGLVIYESVDYVVIRNASGQTSRIEKKIIEERRTQAKSLMPEGLLKDTTPGDLADLYAYLRELGAPQMADAESAASK
jgi:putative heme-binding domain-containing protein